MIKSAVLFQKSSKLHFILFVNLKEQEHLDKQVRIFLRLLKKIQTRHGNGNSWTHVLPMTQCGHCRGEISQGNLPFHNEIPKSQVLLIYVKHTRFYCSRQTNKQTNVYQTFCLTAKTIFPAVQTASLVSYIVCSAVCKACLSFWFTWNLGSLFGYVD